MLGSFIGFDRLKPRYIVCFLFCLIASGLLLVHYRSFGDPPRSDNLSILYFFHNLNSNWGWLHIMNYDPWTQVRYYPLAHLIVYWEFLLFGSCFQGYHIVHLTVYFIALITVYRFARMLKVGRIQAVLAVALLSFLYSHSDMLSWALHTYILIGFIAGIVPFILCSRYFASGSVAFLRASGVFCIISMFCYESFALWPAALYFFFRLRSRGEGKAPFAEKRLKPVRNTVIIVYSIYAAMFFVTRIIHTYHNPVLDAGQAVNLLYLAGVAFGVLGWPLLNGIFINLFPVMANPPRVEDEVFEMAGIFAKASDHIDIFIYAAGVLSAVVLFFLIGYIKKRTYFKDVLPAIYLVLYLYISEKFILFFTRHMTNPLVFIMQQFRYQFISNSFLFILLCLFYPDYGPLS